MIIKINIVKILFIQDNYFSYEINRHEKLTDKLRTDFLEIPKAKNTKTNAKNKLKVTLIGDCHY